MALVFGASILDGVHTKVCTITCLDNDAAADLAVVFLANGMTNFQAVPGAPIDYYWTKTAAAADNATDYMISAVATTGFTIRKLTAAGAGAAITIRVVLRVIHSIDR
jgi:hypothetical protein